MKEWKIEINYIVENMLNAGETPAYQGIPVIGRGDMELKNCRTMIICDVRDDAVKKKLVRIGFEGITFSYNDFLKELSEDEKYNRK